nr:MAG TPA: hypothetical protein [Caudoviricetes sp.]
MFAYSNTNNNNNANLYHCIELIKKRVTYEYEILYEEQMPRL